MNRAPCTRPEVLQALNHFGEMMAALTKDGWVERSVRFKETAQAIAEYVAVEFPDEIATFKETSFHRPGSLLGKGIVNALLVQPELALKAELQSEQKRNDVGKVGLTLAEYSDLSKAYKKWVNELLVGHAGMYKFQREDHSFYFIEIADQGNLIAQILVSQHAF